MGVRKCVLCKQGNALQVAFQLVNTDGLATEIDPPKVLEEFGVCADCLTKYQGQRRTLVFRLVDVERWRDGPKRYLH